MSPHWIALEGGEGSGKTTQAHRLAARLDAVLTREPGGTPTGDRIRRILLDPEAVIDARAEALLMAADRAQHVAEVVRPALQSGRHVVSDRSAYSSLAYQGYGRELGVDDIRTVCQWATGGLWPTIVVLVEVPVELTRRRRLGPDDRLESAGEDFHARVAAGFGRLAAEEPERWTVVDGVGTVDEVSDRIWAAISARIQRRHE